MLSLLTNASAASALRILSATQASLTTTQAAVSTGLRVAGPADSEAYWSIGVQMKAQVATLAAVNDGLAMTKSIVAVTSTAVDQIISIMRGLQADLVTASGPGVDLSAVQGDIAARQQQIVSIAKSASFNGVDWLIQSRHADVTITKTHQPGVGAAVVDAQAALNTAYLNDPTKPVPSGYRFTDAISYTGTATETDSAGTTKSEAVAYQGTDQDQAFTLVDEQGRIPTGKVVARNSVTPATAANFSDTGSVDFKGIDDTEVPMTAAANGNVTLAGIDTTQFALFTNFTGRIDVTDSNATTVVSSGNPSTSHIIFGNSLYRSDQPYTSYDIDNGFEENTGALDADIGVDATRARTTVPEDDLGLLSKTTVLNFVVDGSDAAHQASSIPGMMTTVADAVASLTTMGARLGGWSNRLDTQTSFNRSLSDAITAGIGSLLDADMDVESTRLQALQTQQQLAVQTLSIANQNGRAILALFR